MTSKDDDAGFHASNPKALTLNSIGQDTYHWLHTYVHKQLSPSANGCTCNENTLREIGNQQSPFSSFFIGARKKNFHRQHEEYFLKFKCFRTKCIHLNSSKILKVTHNTTNIFTLFTGRNEALMQQALLQNLN